MENFILQLSLEVGFAGGSECVAYELHRAWLALGLDSRVLTSLATEAEARQGIAYVAPWLTAWGIRARWRHLAALIVVPLFTLIATWRACQTRGAKVILSHGDSLVGDVCVMHAVNGASLAEKRRAGYYGWLFNPSSKQLQEHYQVPDERIVIIPNGINLTRFNPANASSRVEVRRSFSAPENIPLLLFVGSQFRLKGLEFVIRALAEMQTKAILLVVGGDVSGPFKRLAEQLGVRDRVIFAGARSDLPRIYPAADAFVLPSLYETFALVCLEAMASGLPVLASPVGGIEDYLRDGENGLHIQRDPQDIAVKLDRMLNEPELYARLRERGLTTAGDYAWEKIARKYLTLFNEVIAERAGDSRAFGVPDTGISI